MKRRTFLRNTALASAATAFAPYLMKGTPPVTLIPNENIANDNIIIILELFGGNDSLNCIIPANNPKYYNLRPNINYSSTEAIEVNEPSNSGFDGIYMNPAFVTDVHKEGFKYLFDSGRLALVEGTGYDNPNLSHFRSQDIHLTGINSSDPKVSLLEGWLGKYLLSQLPNYPLEIPEHPLAVCIDRSVSLLFKTKLGHMAIALNDPEQFVTLGDGLNPLPEIQLMTDGTTYADEFNFAHVIAQQSEMYSKAVYQAWQAGKDKIQVNYSEGLAQKFKLISALIAGGLKSKVFYLNLSNFDSHAQQMNSDKLSGQHPTLLRQIANGISEFLDDAQIQGWADKVTGMTISEFGRRAYENGSRGTDHGSSALQFVFGGNSDYINGGAYGNSPDLDNLDDNGNIIYQNDFRRVYADFLLNWFGADKDKLPAIFDGMEFLPLGIINPRLTSINDKWSDLNDNTIMIYPNPSKGISNLKFEIRNYARVQIDIFNTKGVLVQNIYQGFKYAGIHEFMINMNQTGNYIISISVNNRHIVRKISVIK